MSEMGDGDSDGEFFSRRPAYRPKRQYSPKRDKVQYNYNFDLSSDEDDDDRRMSRPKKRPNRSNSPGNPPEPPPFVKRAIYNQIESKPNQPRPVSNMQQGPMVPPQGGMIPQQGPMMQGPMMMRPGPMMPQQGPMMPQPGPMMTQPGPMMPQPGPMMPQGPMMNQQGPMMHQQGPMMHQQGPMMPQGPMMMPNMMGMNMGMGMPNQMGPMPMNMGMPMPNHPMCMPPNQMMYPNQMLGPPTMMGPMNPMQIPQNQPPMQQCPPRGRYEPRIHRQKSFAQLQAEEPSPNAIISKPPMLLKIEHKIDHPLRSPSSYSKPSNDSDSEASSADPAEAVGFKNDGSFLEVYKKKLQETTETTDVKKETEVKTAAPKFTPSIVGKRRGGRVLKTGLVEKVKKVDPADNNSPQDPWSIYMAEVKKYRETNCEEEGKTRALVK